MTSEIYEHAPYRCFDVDAVVAVAGGISGAVQSVSGVHTGPLLTRLHEKALPTSIILSRHCMCQSCRPSNLDSEVLQTELPAAQPEASLNRISPSPIWTISFKSMARMGIVPVGSTTRLIAGKCLLHQARLQCRKDPDSCEEATCLLGEPLQHQDHKASRCSRAWSVTSARQTTSPKCLHGRQVCFKLKKPWQCMLILHE